MTEKATLEAIDEPGHPGNVVKAEIALATLDGSHKTFD
jgi:hypothetical protein